MAWCVALENCALSLIVVSFHPTSCKTAFLLRAHPYRVRETSAMFPVFPFLQNLLLAASPQSQPQLGSLSCVRDLYMHFSI